MSFFLKGNVFVRYSDIDEPMVDPSTGAYINKVVFMVFFQVMLFFWRYEF